jgi:hypothetical protein
MVCVTCTNVENYMVGYKIYSLVITIFGFMHTMSMYVVYMLMVELILYIFKN